MIKALSQGAFVLCMAALIGAGTVSPRTVKTPVPGLAGRPTEFNVVTSTTTDLAERTLCQILRLASRAATGMHSMNAGLNVSTSLLPTIWSTTTSSGDGNDDDKDTDKEKDKDKDKEDRAPAPNPEPSTILSFGAALVIGAGVIYLRRLRGQRK